MSNDANNVQLVLDGIIYLGDEGAPAPTGPDFVPGVEYTAIGYYSEDGFVLTPVPGNETEFTAHNGDIVETDQLPGNWTVGLSGIETKAETVEAYFDATIDESDGSVTITKASTELRRSMITIGISSDDKKVVTHYPSVKISDRDPITYNRTTLKAYGMTFRTFKDSTLGYQLKQWDSKLVGGGDPIPPVIDSITPLAQGEDDIVEIFGVGFTGATDVKFGVPSAKDFEVINDSEIAATLPAGAAASVNVTVVTPVGTSPAKAYVRTV